MSRVSTLCAAGVVMILGGVRAGGASEPPALTLTLAPQEIKVGGLVEAVLTIELDAGTGEPPVPTFPNWQSHWGSAEIRELGKVTRSTSGGGGDGAGNGAGNGNRDDNAVSGLRVRYSQTLLLTAFRPGNVTLPPVAVTFAGDGTAIESLTEPATFEVGSVLPVDVDAEALEPKPPAPPRSLPLGSRFWWTAGLLAALAAALSALLLMRRRAEAAEAAHAGTPIDPWDALQSALDKLATAADAETVFTGLSLELRRYLGRSLAFPAAESTTTELRRRLLRSGLPSSVCGDVVRLLVEADAVKFAKRMPAPGRVQECLEKTRITATEVRDFLRPKEASKPGEEAA